MTTPSEIAQPGRIARLAARWSEVRVASRYTTIGAIAGAIVLLAYIAWQITNAIELQRSSIFPRISIWWICAPAYGLIAGYLLGRVVDLMGGTLFNYVFKDLLRIFVMTAGALAGIMSFGGLLRPLTQQGLDASQVGKMLAYFTPAMLAYSLPIAALFSATVVYGRLSADNELTACRAGGISLGPMLGMAFPGIIFGLLVAAISLTFLCFVVPVYTLKVERVIYSNLAKLIANRIERTHEIRFGGASIYADSAYLPPPDPNHRDRQQVVLLNPSIVQYEKPAGGPATAPTTSPKGKPGQPPGRSPAEVDAILSGDANDISRGGKLGKVPKEFLMASSATIDISEHESDDQVSLLIALEGGTRFPREAEGTQYGIDAVQFGPVEIPSPIKEDTKFMPVQKLGELYKNPEHSRKLNTVMSEFVRRDQTARYVHLLAEQLNGLHGDAALNGQRFLRLENKADGSEILLMLEGDAPPSGIIGDGDEVIVSGSSVQTVMFHRIDQPPKSAPAGAKPEESKQHARELHLRVRPDTPRKMMHVTVELMDRAPAAGSPSTRPISGNYSSVIEVPMPSDVKALAERKVGDYLSNKSVSKPDRDRLRRELVVLTNNIQAEFNGRLSFAASCWILVLVGSSLGMMFKSGNFLTAFAISFVPALICITLIVAGQQTCHAVPYQLDTKSNPLNLGIALIWSGNAINLVIAVSLLWKLQRQ